MSEEEFEELATAMAPAIEWYKKHCNLHQRIEINDDGVFILSDDVFYPHRD